MIDILNRRSAIKATSLIFLGLSHPAKLLPTQPIKSTDILPDHFPFIEPDLVMQVVGKSHSDLETVKTLVDKRPELARSVWDWRFGDFESAIGAASHVGRRDIALYLIEKGARPTIFSHAMLGNIEVIRATIEAIPGIQRSLGPHGISLLDHANVGLRMQDKMTRKEVAGVEQTIEYLQNLGDAGGANYIDVNEPEQKKYLGDYRYGEGEKDGFTIQLNMRKLLSLGPIGDFGGAIYKVGENKFIYNGVPSVIISFEIKNEIVESLTLIDPDVKITAKKIS